MAPADKGKAVNFRITEYEPPKASTKENFRRNVNAIKVLRQVEEEKRYATPEEQEILAGYVGWGGLSDAFDENAPTLRLTASLIVFPNSTTTAASPAVRNLTSSIVFSLFPSSSLQEPKAVIPTIPKLSRHYFKSRYIPLS